MEKINELENKNRRACDFYFGFPKKSRPVHDINYYKSIEVTKQIEQISHKYQIILKYYHITMAILYDIISIKCQNSYYFILIYFIYMFYLN